MINHSETEVGVMNNDSVNREKQNDLNYDNNNNTDLINIGNDLNIKKSNIANYVNNVDFN